MKAAACTHIINSMSGDGAYMSGWSARYDHAGWLNDHLHRMYERPQRQYDHLQEFYDHSKYKSREKAA
ncbi:MULTISPECIES: hypothetical protein [unclassified Sporosarcina]|uniref:hypothetical protein n=1 Tax=unclassified Sporosarcina TaxID=2647733 RepID=UPI002041AA87|nr:MULTISPECIES: hypothetical protein [unclassified Sporosarcina]GKV64993.1 hypothetical protein NCCP2331_11460 [Sporosarcina sp. NCCP-2331]GLB56628.1 hypothetical protein NCCP2378_24150 [Sporosarcina sp. NCCP-2378]